MKDGVAILILYKKKKRKDFRGKKIIKTKWGYYIMMKV